MIFHTSPCLDLFKCFQTSIYYYFLYSLAKIGVDTAENEPSAILKFGCRPTTDRGPFKTNVGEIEKGKKLARLKKPRQPHVRSISLSIVKDWEVENYRKIKMRKPKETGSTVPANRNKLNRVHGYKTVQKIGLALPKLQYFFPGWITGGHERSTSMLQQVNIWFPQHVSSYMRKHSLCTRENTE